MPLKPSYIPLLLPLGACLTEAPCPVAFVVNPIDGACIFDEASVLELVTRFDDGTLAKVNDEPFVQVMDPGIRRNVYMTDYAIGETGVGTVELYETVSPSGSDELTLTFPVGTLIVHEAVDREEGHGVLVKRHRSFDNLNGTDWWFGKVYDDGTYDTNACTPCTACHVRNETEGLWGIPTVAQSGADVDGS